MRTDIIWRIDSHLEDNRPPVGTRVLWILQGALAALFLYAGATKLTMPSQELAQLPLPALFMRFIGVAEVIGAAGLVLPGVMRVWQQATVLASAGLVLLMAGATVFTMVTASMDIAMIPLTVGVLAAVVCYGRSNLWNENSFLADVDSDDIRSIS